MDIAGPFKPGKCWDPVASGRDKGMGYMYFLAAAFTIPIRRDKDFSRDDPDPKPVDATLGVEEHQEDSASRENEPFELPDMADLFGGEELGVVPPEDVPLLSVVSRRFGAKKPEPTIEEAQPPLPPPSEAPPTSSEAPPAFKGRTLFMGVPLRSRKGKETLGAVQALVNRLEAFGFPVHRYHSDRAKELRS